MTRDKLILGDKEIVRRYAGDRLVWQKYKVIVTYLIGYFQGGGDELRFEVLDRAGNSFIKSITGIKSVTIEKYGKAYSLDINKIDSFGLYSSYLKIKLSTSIKESLGYESYGGFSPSDKATIEYY